jgi:antitoxin YefM
LYDYTYMAHVSLSELRQNIATFFDQVVDDREPLVVIRQGDKGNVVVISETEFAGWQETVHLLSSPKNAARLMRSIRQIRAGGAREHKLLAPTREPA